MQKLHQMRLMISLDKKDIVNNLTSISNYTVNTPRDIIGNSFHGMYGSKHTIHDLYNKSVSTRRYNYHKEFDKDTHLNSQPLGFSIS